MKKEGIITKTITARPTPEQLAEAYKPWTPENDARMATVRKKEASQLKRKKSTRR